MKQYYQHYHDTLCNEVIPYWLKNAFDGSGAINNCMAEDGTVLSKDRYIWSQGRALWTFSAMYNRIEQKAEYLETAHGLFRYLANIGTNPDGTWNYLYDEAGNIKEGPISIYVDGFVLAGMTEYHNATKNPQAKEIALHIYEQTKRRMATSGSYQVAPYVIPAGMKTHGVNMIFCFFYTCLGRALNRQDILDEGHRLALEVLEHFYVPEKDAILEFVYDDGRFADIPEGRSCVPGHAIECMWFLMDIFEARGETEHIQTCCRLIKRHIELAWDKEHGGMILALDIDGKTPIFWGKPTYKPWWVQVETLVATVAAYRHTNDPWFMEMHKKVFDFAFAHYPNGYGDWINWLDYDGNVTTSAALPVKDPFHLPRGLMYLCKYFGELM